MASRKRTLNRRAFADYVRSWMESNNQDQFTLSVNAGLAPATLSNWLSEKVKPDMEKVDALADAMGVPWERLMGLLLDKTYPEMKELSATEKAALKKGKRVAAKRRVG
jgi:transcriptional regulator with XRE-family HTH domain